MDAASLERERLIGMPRWYCNPQDRLSADQRRAEAIAAHQAALGAARLAARLQAARARRWERERRPMTTEEIVAEIEHLRGSDSPARIAARLGLSTDALAKRMQRNGRPDLARMFWKVAA